MLLVLMLFVFNTRQSGGEETTAEATNRPSALEMTIRRHFSAISGYQKGDLITKSQVEELQTYLRKTNRHCRAAHPMLLNWILPDDCRLSRLFYSQSGAEVLRTAAGELGSYAELEALTRSADSYAALVEAVESEDADTIVELALQGREPNDESQGKERPSRRSSRLYTVEEFLVETFKSTTNESQAHEAR
ncbi:MAG: hypothetical protein KDA57_18270 [Planctomycetales bacterium]|nr:hypothetical protein [Planctomycetales bacterium]